MAESSIVVRLNASGHHTFCAKRFDRLNGSRRFYASAMTLLGKQDNAEGTSSYLEIAEFIANQGDPAFIDADLEQLFRRVVFNIAVGNRDDHLRNHGFILNKNGWRLSPAFDINPNIHKAEHVLNIDTVDNRPSLDTAISTAAYYRITEAKAQSISSETVDLVGQWRLLAKGAGISNAEMLLMRLPRGD
jgi:serine/threonine-protein kinase HipA